MVSRKLGHRRAGRRLDEPAGFLVPLLPEGGLFCRRGPPGGGVVCHPLGLQPSCEVGPARVGERDPFVVGGDDRRHLTRRPDARRELSCLGTSILATDAYLDVEQVPPAIADGVDDHLLVARLHDPHAGRPRAVGHEHFFMAVRSLLRRFDLSHPFSIQKDPGCPPRPHRDLLRSLGEHDMAAGADHERHWAVGP